VRFENCTQEELFYLLIESVSFYIHNEKTVDPKDFTKSIKVEDETHELFDQKKDDVVNFT
jgi:hypothetical protein